MGIFTKDIKSMEDLLVHGLQRTGVGLVHGAFLLGTIQFKPESVDVPIVPGEWVGAIFRLVNAAIVAFKDRGRFLSC